MALQLAANAGTVASASMLGTASKVYVSAFGLAVSQKTSVSAPPPSRLSPPATPARYWAVGATSKRLLPAPAVIVVAVRLAVLSISKESSPLLPLRFRPARLL